MLSWSSFILFTDYTSLLLFEAPTILWIPEPNLSFCRQLKNYNSTLLGPYKTCFGFSVGDFPRSKFPRENDSYWDETFRVAGIGVGGGNFRRIGSREKIVKCIHRLSVVFLNWKAEGLKVGRKIVGIVRFLQTVPSTKPKRIWCVTSLSKVFWFGIRYLPTASRANSRKTQSLPEKHNN